MNVANSQRRTPVGGYRRGRWVAGRTEHVRKVKLYGAFRSCTQAGAHRCPIVPLCTWNLYRVVSQSYLSSSFKGINLIMSLPMMKILHWFTTAFGVSLILAGSCLILTFTFDCFLAQTVHSNRTKQPSLLVTPLFDFALALCFLLLGLWLPNSYLALSIQLEQYLLLKACPHLLKLLSRTCWGQGLLVSPASLLPGT